MARNPQIIVEYLANTGKLSAASADVEKQGSRMGSSAKKLGVALGGAFAVKKAVDFGKAAVGAAVESEKAAAKLETVLRNQGDATGDAAKAAEDYAGRLSRKIGVEDEAIIAAQTLLGSYKSISGEVGRNAGVFDRATAAAADLAAAGFGNLEGNAKTLGKVLDNPAEKLKALGKAGVTFTEAEKKRIETLQKAGKITEAQGIILDKVEGKVKGTAESTATGGEKMAVAFGEFQESVGKVLLPIVEKLTPALGKLADFMAAHTPVVIALAAVLGILAAAIVANNIALAITAIVTGPITLSILAIVAAVAALVIIAVLLWKNWDKVVGALKAGWDRVKAAVAAAINWLKSHWPLILAIIAGPLGLAVLLVVRKWDAIKSALDTAWTKVKAVLGKIADLFGIPADAARTAADAIKTAFNSVLDFLRSIKDRVASAAGRVADAIKKPVNAVIGAINSLVIPAFHFAGKKLPGPIPDIPGFTVGPFDLFPHIPELATGGIVTAPTLAMIGEAGPEAVVPLDAFPSRPLVNVETLVVHEPLDLERIAARLSAAVAVRL